LQHRDVTHYQALLTLEVHGSQTMRRETLMRRFNFPRASHKRKLSAVLLIEPTTRAVLKLHQRAVIVQEQSS